jgi:hypothetical protein
MSAAARIAAAYTARSHHDAGHAALLKYRMRERERLDEQARIPKGQSGGGRFTSGGTGGGGRSGVRRTPEERQAKAAAYLQQSREKRAARSAAAKERAQQTLLFKRAPKKTAPEGGYTVNKVFQGASGSKAVAGIKNKAMVHAKGEIALAEHKARKARTGRTVPPSAAAPAAAPASPIMSQSKGEHAAAVERIKNAPRIHGDKTERQLERELQSTTASEGHAAQAVERMRTRVQVAEKAGHIDDEMDRRKRLADETESHATATTRRKEVESEIAHRAKQAAAPPAPPAAARTGHERKADWEVDQALEKSGRDMRESQIQGTLSHRNRDQVKAHHESLLAEQAKRAPERARKEAKNAERALRVEEQNKRDEPGQLRSLSNTDLDKAHGEHVQRGQRLHSMVEQRARRTGQDYDAQLREMSDPAHPEHELYQRRTEASRQVRAHVEERDRRQEAQAEESGRQRQQESDARASALRDREAAPSVTRKLTPREKQLNKTIDDHERDIEHLNDRIAAHDHEPTKRALAQQRNAIQSLHEGLLLSLDPGVRGAHVGGKVAAASKRRVAAENRRAKGAAAAATQDAWTRGNK